MKNREQDKRICREVFGWPEWDFMSGDWEGDPKVTFFADVGGDTGLAIYEGSEEPTAFFSPHERIEDAMRIVEFIRCTEDAPYQVYWILTDCSQHGWRADIEQVLTENDAPARIASGNGRTLQEAICIAALAMKGKSVCKDG